MRTIAHVTHEAVDKVGGIGTVLEGLLTSKPYTDAEHRTILIGPLFPTETGGKGRLGPAGEVLYSSMDGITRHPVGQALDAVRRDFHVGIVYGHRGFTPPHTGLHIPVEIVLIDPSRMDLHRVNRFKRRLWDAYGIDSKRYEDSWEYDLYVKLAEPALAVLHALGAADDGDECVMLAHEFMGLPAALAARLDPSGAFRTIFHAHEVATVRRIVEHHPGHDVTFYNLLSQAMSDDRYIEDVFGPQDGYYRHALVRASRHCDRILAVGEYVAKELRFLGPEFADADIDVVHNGIPAERITLEEKRESQERMKDYAEALLGDRPDYVFTHVARMVLSKAMWRDQRILEQLEPAFREQGRSAVLFVLSTEVPARPPKDIRDMEQWWHWPVAHREGDPDLSGGEALFYQGVQEFNARSHQIKIVYVNQFGWERAVCGERMPADMSFRDIRCGSDAEFGLSMYEPFGIAQLEPLTYGGICVLSRVCGAAGFVDYVTDGDPPDNVIIADYCDLGPVAWSEDRLLSLSRTERDRHELPVARQVAARLLKALPADDHATAALLERGYGLARRMSWDVISRDAVLPAIEAVCRKYQRIRVA